MFNFGWAELLVIGLVALIVIGPEDLPDMFRQLGRFTAKLRQMSREFSRAMEQAAKESGVKDVAADLKNVTNPKAMGLTAVKEAADKFEKWDPLKHAAKPTTTTPAKVLVPPPMPETPKPAEEILSVFDDGAEAEEDLALDLSEFDDLVQPEVTAPAQPAAHGPATQALYDKQALRAKVLAEQTAKLKAIEEGTYQDEVAPVLATAPAAAVEPAAPPAPPAPPAKKPRATKAKASEVADLAPAAAATPAKPAAPRKTTKKATQA